MITTSLNFSLENKCQLNKEKKWTKNLYKRKQNDYFIFV